MIRPPDAFDDRGHTPIGHNRVTGQPVYPHHTLPGGGAVEYYDRAPARRPWRTLVVGVLVVLACGALGYLLGGVV